MSIPYINGKPMGVFLAVSYQCPKCASNLKIILDRVTDTHVIVLCTVVNCDRFMQKIRMERQIVYGTFMEDESGSNP